LVFLAYSLGHLAVTSIATALAKEEIVANGLNQKTCPTIHKTYPISNIYLNYR